MRDLYNRKEKLANWILKVKTELEEPDRTNVFQFVELSLSYLKVNIYIKHWYNINIF